MAIAATQMAIPVTHGPKVSSTIHTKVKLIAEIVAHAALHWCTLTILI